jgi:hypothetical protein
MLDSNNLMHGYTECWVLIRNRSASTKCWKCIDLNKVGAARDGGSIKYPIGFVANWFLIDQGVRVVFV